VALTAGQPLDAADLDSLDVDYVAIHPASGSSAKHMEFNENYSVYADNTGTGSALSRLWIDCPDGGQVIIGPRAGASLVTDMRLRTGATTATAANMNIDATTYQIKRSTSSLKYKVSVKDGQIDLDAVRRLRVVEFQDRGEHEEMGDAAPWYVGLIAEEVDALGLTEFVAYLNTEDGPVPDGIQYDRITVALLQLAREQDDRLAQMEARLTALEERNN
jgi:hypothetical protein